MILSVKSGDKIFFFSDPHYGHENIVRGTSRWSDKSRCRDFDTIEEMNDVIVKNINDRVGPMDILICLGDWAMGGEKKWGNINKFAESLYCKNIVLVNGNHDHMISHKKLVGEGVPFSDTCDYLFIRARGKEFVCSHYAMISWENMSKGSIHLHGHMHLPNDEKIHQGKSMDIGMDGNGLQVYSLDEILAIMDDQPICSTHVIDDRHEKNYEKSLGSFLGTISRIISWT